MEDKPGPELEEGAMYVQDYCYTSSLAHYASMLFVSLLLLIVHSVGAGVEHLWFPVQPLSLLQLKQTPLPEHISDCDPYDCTNVLTVRQGI